jgi:hypothetical protein
MTMSEGEIGRRRPWWDVPDAATDDPWPRLGVKDREAWTDEADSYSGLALRTGLFAALDAAIEGRAYIVESEQQLLWLAIYLLTDMVKAGDEQLTWLIAEAHHKGLSWTDIGQALGISKQAAHKRFAKQMELTLEVAALREA